MSMTTALYLRISLDDENSTESDSISNQRDLLRAYVAADPVLSVGEILEFSDDGWSGTNFKRPQVTALLDLARRGGVQNIIVKDLSRWGRNYPEVNEYLDQIFPFLGIRFISVNDLYDSNDYKGSTAPMDMAFRSLMHDVYSKELSAKVRQGLAMKTKKGEYVSGDAPFGYVRSKTERNRLVIDETAASTVRRIFKLACTGMSATGIAATLNSEGLDSPLAHRRRTGRVVMGASPINGQTFWGNTQVLRILADERYTGMMVGMKSKILTLGGKKSQYQPESDWIRVPNTHDAIVSTELFNKVNIRIKRKKSITKSISPHRSPFVGKIICGCCGRIMPRQGYKNPYHFCRGTRFNFNQGCYDGKVYIEDLKNVILAIVKAEAQKVLDVQSKRQHPKESTNGMLVAELKKSAGQIAKLEREGLALYEQFADDQITKDAYLELKVENATNLEKVKSRTNELTRHLSATSECAEHQALDESILQRIINASDMTDEILSLISKISIHANGHIEIRFTFGDSNVRDCQLQEKTQPLTSSEAVV